MDNTIHKKAIGIALMLSTFVASDTFIRNYQIQQSIKEMETKFEKNAEAVQQELDNYKTIIDQINENIQKDMENFKKEVQSTYEERLQTEVKQGVQEELDKIFLGEYRISFYDTSHNSQEGWGYQTSSGVSLKDKSIKDRLIACPPEIPLGTKLYLDFKEVPELSGTYTCVDRGGAIKGNKIDVFYEDYNMPNSCWDMGIKYADVYVMGE